MQYKDKPLIIYDTDLDTDCDDVGALSMIYEQVLRKNAELLGIITDTVNPYSAPCAEALGKFYGVERPIGTIYSDELPESETDRLTAYRKHSASMGTADYTAELSRELGKTDKDYPHAVRVYRQLLSASPDGSVTVVCVGLLTAINDLLDSEPDDISPLSGDELVRQKVKRIISMGAPNKEGDNFNWQMDGIAAAEFLARCPVPIYVSEYGTDVITGADMEIRIEKAHPLRRAYEIFNHEEGCERPSWDLIATLFALDEHTAYLRAVPHSKCEFDPTIPRSRWTGDTCRIDYEIQPTVSNDVLASYLDDLMTGKF